MPLFEDEIDINKSTIPADTTGAPEDVADISELGSNPEEELEVAKTPKPPSRYAGKTQDELTQMLEDAQAQIGRQSSEIGEVRKLADELVKNSLRTPVKDATPPTAEEHEDDFFTDPTAAVARAVSRHPAVAAAKEAAELAVRERSASKVLASHPDMSQVIGSPEFAEWVKASPMRVRMYALADQYDAEAADELLTNFKASSRGTTQVVTPPAGAAKAAATLSAGSVGTNATAASAPASKKYRRSDIMRLMTTDPARYEAMADDILTAYAEGRVV